MFTASEYIHLATIANSRNDHFGAIGFLKEALAAEPKNATAHYVLSMLCAELGLIERATRELEEVLQIEPKMDGARLQLGLLYSQGGNPAGAKQHLALLQKSDNPELQAYAEALLALHANDVEQAKDRLVEALRMPGTNTAIKRDMNKLFQSLVAVPHAPIPAATPEKAVETVKSAAPSSSLPAAYEHIRAATR